MKLLIKRFLVLIIIIGLPFILNAQEDYFDESYIRYDDFIYDANIKTVQAYKKGNLLSDPLILLNSGQRIAFEFDDLQRDAANFEYRIIHCDAKWNPSDIQPDEYIKGFHTGRIFDYSFSFNTVQPYTHYNLEFPNSDMGILISGNYLLYVYAQGYEDQPIFTRRFSVYENKVQIEARITKPAMVKDLNYKQRIFFSIDKGQSEIFDPYSNLIVVIKQNGRKDNIINELQPQLVSGSKLIYEHNINNEFSGINEFRNFDIKSMKYYSPRIKNIRFKEQAYHVDLLSDKRRPFQVYRSDEDIDGRYLIKNDEKENSEIESEYVWVNFNLSYETPMIDGNFYILGSLTDWNLDENAAMTYDFETKSYSKKIYLKQGYYNYLYAFLPNGEVQAEVEFAEGQHFETENEYSIYVYYRHPGNQYDQLIGIEWINSRL